MNCYIIVEGQETEMAVYPAWLTFLAPNYTRIQNAHDVNNNNYYIFCGYGQPDVFHHVTKAVEDINTINCKGNAQYDYLLVCLDTEEETRQYLLDRINEELKKNKNSPQGFELIVFEQKVCMESWFLGNSLVFKDNPQDPDYLQFVKFYNVGEKNPENMPNFELARCSTTAKFHLKYLKKMLAERNMNYSKNSTGAVASSQYLEQLIQRYKSSGHIISFGNWYDFVIQHFK